MLWRDAAAHKKPSKPTVLGSMSLVGLSLFQWMPCQKGRLKVQDHMLTGPISEQARSMGCLCSGWLIVLRFPAALEHRSDSPVASGYLTH